MVFSKVWMRFTLKRMNQHFVTVCWKAIQDYEQKHANKQVILRIDRCIFYSIFVDFHSLSDSKAMLKIEFKRTHMNIRFTNFKYTITIRNTENLNVWQPWDRLTFPWKTLKKSNFTLNRVKAVVLLPHHKTQKGEKHTCARGGGGMPPENFSKSLIFCIITASKRPCFFSFFLKKIFRPLPPAKKPCTCMGEKLHFSNDDSLLICQAAACSGSSL